MESWIIDSLAFLGAFFAVIAANAVLAGVCLGRAAAAQRRGPARTSASGCKSKSAPWTSARPEPGSGRPGSNLAGRAGRPHRPVGAERHAAETGLVALAVAIVAGTACWVLSDSAVLALPVAVAASTAPLLYVLRARRQRREKLLAQLPDTFDLMSRVLRAGPDDLPGDANRGRPGVAAHLAGVLPLSRTDELGHDPGGRLARFGRSRRASWKSRSSPWRSSCNGRRAATSRSCSTRWERWSASGSASAA